MRALPRCSRCILPATFPHIEFDEHGVCIFCRNYQTRYQNLNRDESRRQFIERIEGARSKDVKHDVIVPFSGGRDSSYGLHLLRNEFGFNPITFTYDWGMVTDLARRNISRLCARLGVQNILVSANVDAKRDNIRRNVSAWLKKPDLGLVPLFMAGDKYFYKVVNDLRRQTGVGMDVWCLNPLERTDFKSGFCGVRPEFSKNRIDYLSTSQKCRMGLHYLRCFLGNPAYINRSLLDTVTAFLAFYVEPRTVCHIYDYLVWDEEQINKVLIDDYDFELAPDTKSTWRIGDGTAPFYNYIYVTARGFSEFDSFRSNQIREGMLTRERALELVMVENRPRAESLLWYLNTIRVDFNEAIKRINTLRNF